ncbi:hypothetical protein B484DRAFT_414377, partial [Ochromonadaceae sp. CCMP2298]
MALVCAAIHHMHQEAIQQQEIHQTIHQTVHQEIRQTIHQQQRERESIHQHKESQEMEPLTLKRSNPSKLRLAAAAMGIPSEPTNNWDDIMDTAKATLTFTPRGCNGPRVMVSTASKVFCAAFGIQSNGCSSVNIECPLEDLFGPATNLFGPATERSLMMSIELSLLTGENLTKHANLYRLDGKVLSCHLTLRGLGVAESYQDALPPYQPQHLQPPLQPYQPTYQPTYQPLDSTHTHPHTYTHTDDNTLTGYDTIEMPHSHHNYPLTRLAVLTVRSASVHSNATFYGLGLLGLSRVEAHLLESKVGAADLVPG